MDKTRWARIRDMFAHLSEQSPSFRSNYLDMACEDDPVLRLEIENMLESHDELTRDEAQTRHSDHDSHQHLIGTRLGEYEITAVIGSGGMSVVYRANHPDHGEVAIKSLPRYVLDVSEARARLGREARILNALTHPSLCQIYELLQTADQFAVAMEYVEGDNLDVIIERSPLGLSQVLSVAIDLADVLAMTHDQGIVHRDLKPSNILLTSRGGTKLIDFGIAHLSKARLTYTGELLGSPAYMSPEQWNGQAVDGRTDIWALGALLYFMCCGQNAFTGTNIAAYAKDICTGRSRPWPDEVIASEHVVRLRHLVMRMLDRKSENRPERIATVLTELESIAHACRE